MYKIYGSWNSPYSLKVRAYMVYKGIPHQWITKNQQTQEEFSAMARLPLVPLVVTPSGHVQQDSTPIMESLDVAFPEPSAHPPQHSLICFLSVLLEEFGDEWVNKWMFHFRWKRPIDQRVVALRLAHEIVHVGELEQVDDEHLQQVSEMIRMRMTGRGFAVASNDVTAPIIERSFRDGAALLERHLSVRAYLFGPQPSFGDFGMAHHFYQALIDPTAGDWLKRHCPRVGEWCTSLLTPKQPSPPTATKTDARWERWEQLQPTLEPFLRLAVGQLFLPWMAANYDCITKKKKLCVVDTPYGRWENEVSGAQKYQAKSFRVLKDKYRQAASPDLVSVMKRTGCHDYLAVHIKL